MREECYKLRFCSSWCSPYWFNCYKIFTQIILSRDATGLVSPVTDEGINYAMSSGQIETGVIIDAIKADVISAKFLSKYELHWKKDFGKDIKIFFTRSEWMKNKRIETITTCK